MFMFTVDAGPYERREMRDHEENAPSSFYTIDEAHKGRKSIGGRCRGVFWRKDFDCYLVENRLLELVMSPVFSPRAVMLHL